MKQKELEDWCIENGDYRPTIYRKWGFTMSPLQNKLIRNIVEMKHKRFSISAMTRWGKSQCVAIAIALIIDGGVPLKVAFLGPKEEQAGILRQYLGELIASDPELLEKTKIDSKTTTRIDKEASRKRMTFRTGAEYRVFSAEGDADRLMGFGCVPFDAEITTNKGIMTAKAIYESKDDISILSYDHKNQVVQYKSITHKFLNPSRDFIKVYHDADSFTVTDNHPVYVVGKGYVNAMDLCNNDKIYKYNCINTSYANNKMSSVRKHILQKTESHRKNINPVLQLQMQRRMAERQKQSPVERWKKEINLFRMQKRVLCKSQRGKKILQSKMQRYSKKKISKTKSNASMSILRKRLRKDTSTKGFQVLFERVCKQESFGKDANGKKPSMERWNKKFTMVSKFQQKAKDKNTRKRQSQMFSMWKNRLSSNTSYRLRQDEFFRRKPDDLMCELPLQDKLQKRDVEKVSINRIKEIPNKNKVYNFEVEDNHNYFVNGILTHNCDILIRDEACLINRRAYVKSARMIGDNPEHGIIIELYNPWDKDNVAYEHTLNPEWETFHVGWKDAVKDGRTTEKFVLEQKRDLLPLDFQVLYDSKFPDQADDSLYSLKWVNNAVNSDIDLETPLKELLKVLEKPQKHSENKVIKAREEMKKYKKIVSLDPAEKGKDESVCFWGLSYDNRIYQIVGCFHEPKSEPMKLVGRVLAKAEEYIEPQVQGNINIDRIGLGSGTFSRMRELVSEKNLRHIKVVGCHYGEAAIKKDEFQNKKAENFFRNAKIFQEENIKIPDILKLRKELVSMKWERSSANKKKILDPEDKSPDYADGCNYFTWKNDKELLFGFV